ncbi:MAG: zf-HC2 domain-containing protein [Vicinamibacterales bacterium]
MCDQREQILEYLYDEASPTSRRDVERHLDGCDECRDEIRAFRNVREDLLAWGVPNPPSVWTAFAPPPALPWHKQVPAWAMAIAASLMFMVGTAGGVFAHRVVDGNGLARGGSHTAAGLPPEVKQAALLDSKAIVSLIREELSNADRDLTGRALQVNNTTARPFQLDPRTEARLLDRVSGLVNESQDRQRLMVSDYLFKVAQEDELRRRDTGRRFTQLTAQVEQLQAAVSQLVLAQSKGQ